MHIFILISAFILIIANIVILKLKTVGFFKKKLFRYLFLAFSIVIILEAVVFNFRSFIIPINNLNYTIMSYDNVSFSGVKLSEKGVITDGSGTCTIEIPHLDDRISNIYFNIEEGSYINSRLSFKDEGYSELYIEQTTDRIVPSVPRSRYIFLPHYINTRGLKLRFDYPAGNNFVINGIELNKTVPFSIIPLRMLAVLLILIFIYFFRPRSEIYKIKFNFKSIKQKIVIFSVLAFQIIIIAVIPAGSQNNETNGQYHALTDLFLSGRISLPDTPHEGLAELSNPYDPTQREEAGIDYKWEYSYYKNKYFIYHGPVPVLAVYLPYKVITGKNISTLFVSVFFSVLAAIAFWGILKTIFERWFKNASLPLFLLIFLAICQGSLLLAHLRSSQFNDAAAVSGLAFASFGIWALLDAFRGERTSIPKLITAAVMLSLSAGCRPTFILLSAASLAIFTAEMKFRGKFFKKENIKPVVIFALPFAVIGGALMIYNYIRFDSVFEFGHRYQLTSYDNSKYSLFQFSRIFQGLFDYFFNFPTLNIFFPFIHSATPRLAFTGFFNNISSIALFVNPIAWSMILYLFLNKKNRIKDLRLNTLMISFIISAIIMCFIEITYGGIDVRYAEDFFWLLLFAATITFLAIYEKAKSLSSQKFIILFLLFAFIAGFSVNLAVPLNFQNNSWDPDTFSRIEHAVTFWS